VLGLRAGIESSATILDFNPEGEPVRPQCHDCQPFVFVRPSQPVLVGEIIAISTNEFPQSQF
jgi:hypothetical protein